MIDWGKVPNASSGSGGGLIDWGADTKPPPAVTKKAKQSHDIPLVRRGLAALQWAAQSPVARGLDAVINAPTRMIEGTIMAEPGEWGGLNAVRNPAGATELTHRTERAVGIPMIAEQPPTSIAGLVAKETKQPRSPLAPIRDIGQAVEDAVFETLISGGLGAPGAIEHGLGGILKSLARVSRADRLAGKVVGSSPVQRLLGGIVEGHHLRKGAQRPGEDIIKGREIAGSDVIRREEQRYGDLIERHRDVLNEIDAQRADLRTQMAEPGRRALARAGYARAQQELDALKTAYNETTNRVPPEIRTSLLQRAYIEGTPEVRRKVLAKGYVPTAEDRSSPVLNILHNFNDEYEPTQRLFSEAELASSGGPVRYVHQQRKASFDLPKKGAKPEDPLADRLLDRFVRGSRLAVRETGRRASLRDLGLAPLPVQNVERAIGRSAVARAAGDTQRAGRYDALIGRQNEALKAAEARREVTLQPGAPEATQPLELIDPVTARNRALVEMRKAGTLPEKTPGALGPRSPIRDVRTLIGKVSGTRRAVVDAEQFARIMARAAGRTASTVGREAARTEKTAGKAAEKIAGATLPPFSQGQRLRGALEAPKQAAEAARKAAVATRVAREGVKATTFPKTGWGKKADEIVRAMAEDMRRSPRYRQASHVDPKTGEMHAKGYIGGQYMKMGGYSPTKADIARVRSALKKVGVTKNDAEIENALGQATDAAISQVESGAVGAKQALTEAQAVRDAALAARKKAGRIPLGVRREGQRTIKATETAVERAYGAAKDVGKQTPAALERLANPSATAAKLAHERLTGTVLRHESDAARLARLKETNAAIERVRNLAAEDVAATNTVAMPEAVKQRLFGDKAVYEKSLARSFSDLQRDALFVLPFAHQKNITVLAALGPGGARTVANGMRYAHQLKADPVALEARIRGIEEIGASSHYIRDVEPVYAKIPVIGQKVAAFAQRGNAALERYDMGMRLALEDELKRNGVTGFAAGGQIRDVLGDYTNQAPLIQELRNRLGANFPAWRLGIVPRAMTKAIREHPGAMKQYARLERLFSDDVTQPAFGGDVDLGGPLEDYGQMLFPRPALGNFYTSESTVGPARSVADFGIALSRGQAFKVPEREALRVLPFGSVASNAFNLQGPSNAPMALRAAGGLAGAYFPNRQTLDQRRRQLISLGMSGAELNAVLRSEGYLRPLPVGATAGGGLIDWSRESSSPAGGLIDWSRTP